MTKYKTEWDLTPIYKSDNDPKMLKDRKTCDRKVNAFIKKWKENKDYLKKTKAMLEILQEYEELLGKYVPYLGEGYYYFLRKTIEQDNTDLKSKDNLLEVEANKLLTKLTFVDVNISRIPKEDQSKFLKYKPLSNYKHFLESQFRKGKYMLSEEEENILIYTTKTSFFNWTEMVERFLGKSTREIVTSKGKEEKTFHELVGLLSSANLKEVDNAGKAVNEILKEYAEVSENELNSVLEYKKNLRQIKGLERPDTERVIKDDVTHEIIDNLIQTVSKYFKTSKRFYKLFAKLLGKKQIGYHQRVVDLGISSEEASYSECVKLVTDTFRDIDPIFSEKYNDLLARGAFDVDIKKGKSGGAFHISVGKHFPPYVMLNFNKKLMYSTTIAHEVGHAFHSWLSNSSQTGLNADYSFATAEVASTFFEDFVLKKITEQADEETRFLLNVEKLKDLVAAIFRQTAFYNFELDLHDTFDKKGYLSYQEIGALFKKHMASYLGSAVDMEGGFENWWIYVGHFRRPFYVFNYVSGELISKSFQAAYREDPKSIEQFKKVLSAGSSKSVYQIFKDVGVDITDSKFWEKGLREIEVLLNETEKLGKKLGKL